MDDQKRRETVHAAEDLPAGKDASAFAMREEHPANDILALIHDREPEFSRSHRKIAQAILGHPRLFVEKPIEELVPWLGVSAPTITRFSRAVGCEGLRDLKLKVMGSMRESVPAKECVTTHLPNQLALKMDGA